MTTLAGRGADTLRFRLEDGLVGLVGVLHGDGVGELGQHPLLEGLQPLVVVPSTHELLILGVEQQQQKSEPCKGARLLQRHQKLTVAGADHAPNQHPITAAAYPGAAGKRSPDVKSVGQRSRTSLCYFLEHRERSLPPGVQRCPIPRALTMRKGKATIPSHCQCARVPDES